MTDAQMAAIREQDLVLVKTILSGDLHVRDAGGVDHLLDVDGEFQPFELDRSPRAPA